MQLRTVALTFAWYAHLRELSARLIGFTTLASLCILGAVYFVLRG